MVGSEYVIDTPTTSLYHSNMPRLRHYDDLGTARFITFSCYRRRKYMTDVTTVMILLYQLKTLRSNHAVKILGYVVMPDHVHLVLLPPDGSKLGVLIGQLKGRSAHEIIRTRKDIIQRSSGQPAIWQRRCYDHNCRTPDVVIEKIRYCHNNPVSRGLVGEPGDWPWSSYGWYNGDSDCPFDIDGIEL
ncbi:MAG: hypothetical protein DRP47_02740 [Candidatus Zixiibacteriota bacterium]|nr:MAG: hypothetical protein DRP47_02740 [candidate division Zixibacteria bacterium]